MENSDRGNKVSKEDVQNAFAMLGAIMFLGLMAILYWIMELMLNPYKLEQFINKVNTIIEPLMPLFQNLVQILMLGLGVVIGIIIVLSLRTMWDGREHVAGVWDDILQRGDK